MPQCPRRTILGGIGTTLAAALAGTSAVAAGDASAADAATDSTFDDLFAYLPAAVASESMVVNATDYDRLLEADQPHDPLPAVNAPGFDPEAISKGVFVTSYAEEYERPLKVVSGDVELDGTTDTRETDAGIEYEFAESGGTDEGVLGTDGDVLVVAADVETVEAAFDANAGEADRLLEAEPTVEEGLAVYEGSDARSVQFGDDHLEPVIDDGTVPEYVVHAQTVLDPDTIEITLGAEFEDESDITDELIETLEAEFAYTATADEPTVDVDGSFVGATIERDLAAERAVREHDSPGFLRADRDPDLDDDVLEIEIGRGDPTPVEDLTLEVGDEPYDREIWTNGHGTLEEGDTIVIDMDDIEPNLSVRLRHDHELGGSSSGTTILSRLRFESRFDVDTGEFTLEYTDDIPLDGDRLYLATYENADQTTFHRPDEDIPEPKTTAQPWDGETVSDGATATRSDIEAGNWIIVGWDGTTHQDSVWRVRADPPGNTRFEYDYDTETLKATLEFENTGPHPEASSVGADRSDEEAADDVERSASEYELLIDDEPADTQWTDEFETVSSGATIELEDVPIGSKVEVVWADTDTRIGWTRPEPSVILEYDDGTVEHVGGDTLPASDLEAKVWTAEGHYEISLDEQLDAEFAPDSTFTVDAETLDTDEIDTVHHVELKYDGEHRVGFAHPDR
ncbi:hypothetical protein RBH26_20385 [Natronolimnohabitans sp. A-GB9]|uniref:hypothetical protein n=1 Tax=Natronolimnohabitans sp. A-GB9 TaxID=3069757 RepID=UPI0027ADA5F1|nr:hypothetical protein [Natronolimnohabitans sp. A-GB9]MDQ2052802.1 hypothetical protein [Natronolimnohabitans sp. A-GB9]